MNPIVRSARPDDYPRYAELHLELGREFPVPPSSEWSGDLANQAIFAEVEGKSAGYALGSVFGTRGHVSQLVVAPAFRGRGVGRALMRGLAERFRVAGAADWQLNVKKGNEPALALYDRLGFRTVHETSWVRLPWELADRLPPSNLVAAPVEPSRDLRIELAFGLPVGRLAWFRQRSLLHLLEVLGPDGESLAFTSFLAPNGAAGPFRSRDPRGLRPLVEGMRNRAQTAHASIAVEGDPTMLALLRGLGGEVTLETFFLVGDLAT